MSEQKRIPGRYPANRVKPTYCGYGSCDKTPGHDGMHRCRCGKPVDEPSQGCEWHTPGRECDEVQP